MTIILGVCLAQQLPLTPSAQASTLTEAYPTTALTAVVMPAGRYSPVALEEMEREAAGILKNSGILFRWRTAPAEASEGMLVVVLLRGHCNVYESAPALDSGPLGWSDLTNGVILPFVELACDRIRGTIQSAPGRAPAVRSNLLLGQAMGRILAHELYHVIANTSTHGGKGVAKAEFSPGELTSGLLELDSFDLEAIEKALRRAHSR